VGLLAKDWQAREGAAEGGGPSAKGLKNFYTAPARKGGMGFSHKERTIGGNPPAYMPDEYQRGRELGKGLRKAARQRIRKPFNSSPNTNGGLFSPSPCGEPPGPAHIPPARPKAAAAAAKRPFVAPGPARKGAAYAAMSKIGRDYISEPFAEKV
jgi:Domain of unknown function (DUF4586)